MFLICKKKYIKVLTMSGCICFELVHIFEIMCVLESDVHTLFVYFYHVKSAPSKGFGVKIVFVFNNAVEICFLLKKEKTSK